LNDVELLILRCRYRLDVTKLPTSNSGKEMRNTILTAMFLMLMPGMASAQFYTITKEARIESIRANDKEKAIDNKKDTTQIGSNNEPKDTLKVQSYIRTYKRLCTQKVDGKTSQKFKRVKSNGHLPELTIPNLYTEIKKNGILYPKVVLAQAILGTGWFTSPLCRDRHNLFGLTNPRTGKYYEFAHWSESVRAYYTKVQYKYKREDGNYLLWLKKIGYAEAPDYIPAIISVLKML
jgi:flagellum-specific peptidoglycan hydrolase FlgJ